MAAELKTRARKWGDSIAVIIPRAIAQKEGLRVDDQLHLTLHRETDLSDLFGVWKTGKTPLQLKHESRNGWE